MYLHLCCLFLCCIFGFLNCIYYFCNVFINHVIFVNMKDRIASIINKEGVTNAQFADKIGISASSLSHILSGRNQPSLDVFTKIHEAYPSIRLEWLLEGVGEVCESESDSDVGGENGILAEGGVTDGEGLFAPPPAAAVPVVPQRKAEVVQEVKVVERPAARITEIRVFFDNGTYEIFKPGGK